MGIDRLKLAIFISGRGSNMQAIIDHCACDSSPFRVDLVLSNRPHADGLRFAQEKNIATEIVDHTLFDDRHAFENDIQKRLSNYDIDMIALAGFMRVLTPDFVTPWSGRMVNIHPSLLPEYKGLDTHARALADGKKEAGCTVHYVTPDLDGGAIIAQHSVPIHEGDTVETLEQRVRAQEHIIYPKAIEKVARDVMAQRHTHKSA